MESFTNTNANTNVSNPSIYVNETEFDPNRFIQDHLNTNAVSNPSLSHIQVTSIDDIIDMAPVKTQNTLHTSYNTPIQGLQQHNIYDHNDIALNRNLPEHYANTNINQNIHKPTEYVNSLQFERKMPLAVARSNPGTRERNLNEEISSRNYKLAPKVNAGGFDGKINAPTVNRQSNVYNLNTGKSNISRKMGESFENRYQSIMPRA